LVYNYPINPYFFSLVKKHYLKNKMLHLLRNCGEDIKKASRMKGCGVDYFSANFSLRTQVFSLFSN
jgi:hypothetical protein